MKKTMYLAGAFAVMVIMIATGGRALGGSCMDMDHMMGMGDVDMDKDRGGSSMKMGDRTPGGEPSAGSPTAKIGSAVICPVDGMKVGVTADTPATEYQGKLYYFCSDADQRAFLRQPERYATR